MIENYQKLLNLQDAVFTRIDHHDAMVAIVYKITRANGEEFILKISDRPNDTLREVHFLKYFRENLPVPKIIQVFPSAILMEYLPGTLLKEADLTEELAYEIGCSLAKIHSSRLPGYGDPIGTLNNDPRIYFTMKFEEGLEECREHFPTDSIKKYYAENVDLLLAADGPCVAHRDFRPGNLLVHEGMLKGIIDWAGARASCAEEDLCALEHGEWASLSHRKKFILEGYASVRPVPDYELLLPFLRLNKAIATIGFTVKRGTWQNKDASLYRYNLQFLAKFLEGGI